MVIVLEPELWEWDWPNRFDQNWKNDWKVSNSDYWAVIMLWGWIKNFQLY